MSELSTFGLTFTALGKSHADYARKAGHAAARTAHLHGRGGNLLTAMRQQATQPEVLKAHETCLCETRRIDGKLWTLGSPDCPEHGVCKFNPDFAQNAERSATKGKRHKAQGSE